MRRDFLPFSKPFISRDEIREVMDSLKSGWITTGPKVQKFERNFSQRVQSKYAIAVNSGTAGLHLAYLASGLKPGDEVITTSLTFVSTISMLLAVGAKPILADIDRSTLNIDPDQIKKMITRKTRAIVPVHFAGLPCDMDVIHSISRKHGLKVIEDAAHAMGSQYKGKKIGSSSDACVFSFHPIKNITTGEGGMITTSNGKWAQEMNLLRFHGMSKTAWNRYGKSGSPHYDIKRLGFKYNMMDIQAALGIHQLEKLEKMNEKRSQYAKIYDRLLGSLPEISLPQKPPFRHVHSWHLYVMILERRNMKIGRDEFLSKLREENIGTGVHFRAVHEHLFYKNIFKSAGKSLPNAQWASDGIFSLPLYPAMKKEDVEYTAQTVIKTVKKYTKIKWNPIP